MSDFPIIVTPESSRNLETPTVSCIAPATITIASASLAPSSITSNSLTTTGKINGKLLSAPMAAPASLAPSTTASATGNPRNKTALKPGRGLMDWVRLGHSGKDLAGTGGKPLSVTPQELAKHNKPGDAWMALKGIVYNVSAYTEFHPGGVDELMRGVGTDATDLFNEVHKWVNFESMLQKCVVGRLVESSSFFSKPNFLPLRKLTKGKSITSNSNSNVMKPPSVTSNYLGVSGTKKSQSLDIPDSKISNSLSIPINTSIRVPNKTPLPSPLSPTVSLPLPKYDWFQASSVINIAIYTKWKYISKYHIAVERKDRDLKILCYIEDKVFTVHLILFNCVKGEAEIKVGANSGKVDILMKKFEEGVRWSTIGKTGEQHNTLVTAKNRNIEYVSCTLEKVEKLTHDTHLFTLALLKEIYLPVLTGHHIYLRLPGSDIVKPYTPVTSKMEVSSLLEDIGKKIHLLVKIYSDGAFTPTLMGIAPGRSLEVSFPEGNFLEDKLRAATCSPTTHLICLAAGTGITPMVKLSLTALENNVKVLLVFFNKTEQDIPWRQELDQLHNSHQDLFTVVHVLSQAGQAWTGHKGRVNKELLISILPPQKDPDTNIFSCACGPQEFTKLSINLFKDLGYEDIHAFLG